MDLTSLYPLEELHDWARARCTRARTFTRVRLTARKGYWPRIPRGRWPPRFSSVRSYKQQRQSVRACAQRTMFNNDYLSKEEEEEEEEEEGEGDLIFNRRIDQLTYIFAKDFQSSIGSGIIATTWVKLFYFEARSTIDLRATDRFDFLSFCLTDFHRIVDSNWIVWFRDELITENYTFQD